MTNLPGLDHAVVHIVDDDQAVLDGLATLISSVGLETRCYRAPFEFLETLERSASPRLACAIIDERMPLMTGRALQEQLQQRHADMPVIILTAFPDVQVAVDAMKLGAFQFLAKPARGDQLIETVQRALRWQATRLCEREHRVAFEERLRRLTSRERQVMKRVVRGASNMEIADELTISKRTVELHRFQLMKKMGAHSLAELVRDYTLYETWKAASDQQHPSQRTFEQDPVSPLDKES